MFFFFIIGVDVYFVMQSLGEMSTLFLVQGAFVEHTGRFVDPALAFAIGWEVLCVLSGFLAAILINTGAIGGDYIGFRYRKILGPFVTGISDVGQAFVLAAVYYCGTEMLALTAAESKNPKRNLPRAIRQTFSRILMIFVGLVFFAGLIVPANNDQLLMALPNLVNLLG